MSASDGQALVDRTWPDGLGLPESIGFLARLARLVMMGEQIFSEIAERHRISFHDYLVLATTGRSAPATSPSQLCRILGRTSGGMTLTLDRLEQAGWLQRSPDPDDRRRVLVRLTPSGRRLSDRVNRALHDWERRVVPAGDAEELDAMVDRLLEVVSEPEPGAGPDPLTNP